MALYLLQGIQYYPYQNQQRGTSEELGKAVRNAKQLSKSRQYGNNSEEYGSRQGNARHDTIQVICRFFPGLIPGINPLFRFISSAIWVGWIVIAV